jgi:hypothetical protein
MTFAEFAPIADTINAVVVTLTLVVLIVSIRQNTKSQRVLAVESLTAAIASINVPAMESPALGAALSKATADWAAATRDERIIAHYFLVTYFKLLEQAWYQHKAGVLDAEQWTGWDASLRRFFHSPGVQTGWWPGRQLSFSVAFRAYLASTKPVEGEGTLFDLFDAKSASI